MPPMERVKAGVLLPPPIPPHSPPTSPLEGDTVAVGPGEVLEDSLNVPPPSAVPLTDPVGVPVLPPPSTPPPIKEAEGKVEGVTLTLPDPLPWDLLPGWVAVAQVELDADSETKVEVVGLAVPLPPLGEGDMDIEREGEPEGVLEGHTELDLVPSGEALSPPPNEGDGVPLDTGVTVDVLDPTPEAVRVTEGEEVVVPPRVRDHSEVGEEDNVAGSPEGEVVMVAPLPLEATL